MLRSAVGESKYLYADDEDLRLKIDVLGSEIDPEKYQHKPNLLIVFDDIDDLNWYRDKKLWVTFNNDDAWKSNDINDAFEIHECKCVIVVLSADEYYKLCEQFYETYSELFKGKTFDKGGYYAYNSGPLATKIKKDVTPKEWDVPFK